MEKLRNIKRAVIQHIGIVIGASLLAFSYSWFLIPYKISPGGVGGLSQILYHIFHIPAGTSMIILNIPLFVMSFVFLGKRFGARSIFGMVSSAFLTDLFSIPNLYKFGFIKDLSQ
ncbi:MAG: membrane protein, partial [Candidatus Cloacimonadota bacterium]